MKSFYFILCLVICLYSCKKDYTCNCYTDRRGYVQVQFTKTYKERKKNKDKALISCQNDYLNDPNYYDQAYCEIK